MAGDQAGDVAAARGVASGFDRARLTVAEVVAPLAVDGARLLHERRLPDGTVIDLVIVAPSGVFVVQPVGWPGRVDIDGGAVHLDGVRQDGVTRSALERARAVSALLDSWTGPTWSVPTYGVVCLAGEGQVGGWAASGGVHLVDVAWIGDFIANLEPQLGPQHVDWAHRALGSRLPAVVAPPVPQVRAEPAPPEPPVVFLRRVRAADSDRFEVIDEEGTLGGYLDVAGASTDAVVPQAVPVLAQLLPHFVPGAARPPAPRGLRRWFSRSRGGEIELIAGMEWVAEDDRRLYGFHLRPAGERTDLGWVDLVSGRTAEVVTGAGATLRWCASCFVRVVGRSH